MYAIRSYYGQPMGFYAPAQLVQDARRHGVRVLPVDATVSDWDCTLEGDNGSPSPRGRGPEGGALRLGLRMVKGLSRAGGDRIVAARARAPIISIDDLANRARLSRHDLEALAGSSALASLAGNRHQAGWQVLGVEPPSPILQNALTPEGLPLLRQPTDVITSYSIHYTKLYDRFPSIHHNCCAWDASSK